MNIHITRIRSTVRRRRWSEDWGNVMTNPRNGLFGAVVVGPKGSKYRDPKTGADLTNKNAWMADVIIDRSVPGNEMRPNYRRRGVVLPRRRQHHRHELYAVCSERGRFDRRQLSVRTV